MGGVFDGETAYEKIKCGASLLQLYTSLVYQGPLIASSINEELSNLLDKWNPIKPAQPVIKIFIIIFFSKRSR